MTCERCGDGRVQQIRLAGVLSAWLCDKCVRTIELDTDAQRLCNLANVADYRIKAAIHSGSVPSESVLRALDDAQDAAREWVLQWLRTKP